jgi:hypothetical protein
LHGTSKAFIFPAMHSQANLGFFFASFLLAGLLLRVRAR